MGTADVVAAPTAPVLFVEDMSAEEKAEKGAVIPGGLVNLRKSAFIASYEFIVIVKNNVILNREHMLHERNCGVL